MIKEIEDRIFSLTRMTLTKRSRFWDNQKRTNNSNPSQINYGIRFNHDNKGKKLPKG